MKLFGGAHEIKWAVTGSTGLALQEMVITPDDLDVYIASRDIERAREILKKYEPTAIQQVNKENGQVIREFNCKMGEVPVQFFTADENDPYTLALKEWGTRAVCIGTLFLPVMPLEAQAQAYRATGRAEKAEAVEKYLSELIEHKKDEKKKD